MTMIPYRSTPVFDESTLPQALRRDHSTKPGVWGLIQVLEGTLMLHFADGRQEILSPTNPGILRPGEVHWVDPIGKMQMQVDFYDCEPPPTRS